MQRSEALETPNGKTGRGGGSTPRSSLLFAAQALTYERRRTSCTRRRRGEGYKMLPTYGRGTGESQPPPSSSAPVNPFDDCLVRRMTETTCSPDMFADVRSPTQCTEFRWTIEDIAKIRPATIDSPVIQIDGCVDDETETQAQEAIEQYFSMTHNVTSPADGVVGPWVSFNSENTPEVKSPVYTHHHNAVSTPCTRQPRPKTNTSTTAAQTTWSFPPTLPKDVMDLLKPYMTEQAADSSLGDDANTSVNTLRRKLFFHHEDISPVKGGFGDGGDWLDSGRAHQWSPERGASPPTPDVSPIRVESTRLEYTKGPDGVETLNEIFSSTRTHGRGESQDTGFVSGEALDGGGTL